MSKGKDWELEKDNLKRLIVDEKKSYLYIGSLYGCSGNNIKKVAKKLGIPLNIRRSLNKEEIARIKDGKWGVIKLEPFYCLLCGREVRRSSSTPGKFCSRRCFIDYRKKGKDKEDDILTEKWLKGEIDGTVKKYFTYKPFVRRYLFKKYNNKCQKCGWGEINKSTGLVPLQIHHIDGDALNNSIDNIELLCPNCHSLTDNFGSRNKNASEGRSKCFKKASKRNSI